VESKQISLEGIKLDVIRKDIKNIHLYVYPPMGHVRISLPIRMSMNVLRDFIISKLSWIKKKQSKFLSQPPIIKRKYLSGESHDFKGQKYLLNLIYHDSPPKVELRDQMYIDLYVRRGSSLQQRRKAMIEWYRYQLKLRIPILISKWEKILGLKLASFGVKLMKTRWGTCNIKAKRIWINLELAKKSDNCLEYIIVHELMHLFERKHNHRFRVYMDKFLPQWRNFKKELNHFAIAI